jgi:hypothetical protein
MSLLRLRGQACALLVLTAPLVLAAPASAKPKPKPPKGLPAPAILAPAEGATSDTVPAFSWKPVKGAARYELELSADSGFNSTVQIQSHASLKTLNTFAAADKALPNGTYYWHVRSLDADNAAGAWSKPRSLRKSWTTQPVPQSPGDGTEGSFPNAPIVLSWSSVARAYKYLVYISTDPALGSLAVSDGGQPIETSANAYAITGALAPGRYYWAVVPEDSEMNKGVRSAVRSFSWAWPSTTNVHVASTPTIFNPVFSWDAVPGAVKYQVEANYSPDFATGSKVCCDGYVFGTTYSPVDIFPNSKAYHWRVRAIDPDGNSGVWNTDSTVFEEHFDAVTPSIPNLHVRDNTADPAVDLDPISTVLDTSAPLVTWDPVPGASSYDVKVAPYVSGACNWGDTGTHAWQSSLTATTAWSPLAPSWSTSKPGGASYPQASKENGKSLVDGTTYCVQVVARADRDPNNNEVESPPTQVNGLGQPAFRYVASTTGNNTPASPFAATALTYGAPAVGVNQPRTPYFTWNPIDGAKAYYVVVAADQFFTNIVDFAITLQPTYAPRTSSNPMTYPDADGAYYWAVIPCSTDNCSSFTAQPGTEATQQFRKTSTPPILAAVGLGPTNQPTFSWSTSAGLDMPGVRAYRIQVAQDPSFGSPIDDVLTDSTTYTPVKTYPADTALWWRVRADDENLVGLNWSAASTFTLSHGAPLPLSSNATSGEQIPVMSWTPVPGAVGYDLHLDQADGTTKDFPGLRASSVVFNTWYGTGIWHWSVRAVFPKTGTSTTPGPYSAAQPFTRTIGEPTGATQVAAPGKVLFSWSPALQSREYRVQVSAANSFTRTIDDTKTDNTYWAPDLSKQAYVDGGVFYWRVATVDEGGNVGGWTVHSFKLPPRLIGKTTGYLRVGKAGKVILTITDPKRVGIKGVKVSPAGIGVVTHGKLTLKKGVVRFVLKPKRKGAITFTLSKKGYQTSTVLLKVGA